MRKIFLFMNVSLDGYFEDKDHGLSWAHSGDFEAFSSGATGEVDTLLFGRKTYEMFRNFWPTPQAAEFAPEVAKYINERLKVVVSRQPYEPGWHNVRVINTEATEAVRQLKEQPGKNIIIFGSNMLCVSLMQKGLIDEFQLMVNPVALGEGTSLFKGLPENEEFTLANVQQFKSGKVLLTYQPAKK
jgi:dihydrofolate reductase